jgi:hypothetical protein
MTKKQLFFFRSFFNKFNFKTYGKLQTFADARDTCKRNDISTSHMIDKAVHFNLQLMLLLVLLLLLNIMLRYGDAN